MFGKIKAKLLFISVNTRKLLIWAVNSSISQSHYCISTVVKATLSGKFHGKMTMFASVFVEPMKIRAPLFLHFCLRSDFTFIFQGHMKVALSDLV